MYFLFCKQKTAYEMRISDWSSDVCSSDLSGDAEPEPVPLRVDARPDERDQRKPDQPGDPQDVGVLGHPDEPRAGTLAALDHAIADRGDDPEGIGHRQVADHLNPGTPEHEDQRQDRKSTRLNSSH